MPDVTVSVPKERLFPLYPPGSLVTIDGISVADIETFRHLAAIPGSFVKFGDHEQPIPASGDVVFGEFSSTERWPNPLYVPVAQRQALLEALGLPLDHSDLLPPRPLPDALPIAPFRGLDPTGKEWRLYPHQMDGVREARRLKRAVCPMGVGLGKSAESLALGNDLLLRKEIDRVIVATTRRSMRATWAKFLREFLNVEALVIDGSPDQRKPKWKLAETSPWVVTKYGTWRLKDGKVALTKLLGPRTLVIIDEVHHLKNPATKRWHAFRDILDKTRTEYRLLLTGTLIYDTPDDVFGPLEILGLHIWNTQVEFHERYFNIQEVRTGIDNIGRPRFARIPRGIKSAQDAAELRSVLDAVSTHPSWKPINISLPEMVPLERFVEPTEVEKFLYRDVVKAPIEGMVGDKDTTYESMFSMMTMERMFSDDPILIARSQSDTAMGISRTVGARLTNASPGSKLLSLLEFLGDFVAGTKTEKVIVFSSFKTAVDRIVEVIETDVPAENDEDDEQEIRSSLRGKYVTYHGELTDKQGDAQVQRFLTDPNIQILFSTDAGGESLNLQVATTVVHFDDALSLGQQDQRVGRIYGGLRQTRPVRNIRMVFGPTEEFLGNLSARVESGELRFVDHRIRDLLNWKKAQRDLVLS